MRTGAESTTAPVVVVDLNADVGERPGGLDDDRQILASVTSASVACGGHAGNTETMRAVCAAAVERDVRIGAHVSYRDPGHFGRRDQDIPPELLREEIVEQISRLIDAADGAGARVCFVKPHGALYHRCARDPSQAAAVAAAIAAVNPGTCVVVPPGSALGELARSAGLVRILEGYADRGYAATGSLLSRDQPGAVLGPDAAAAQARMIAQRGAVAPAAGGSPVALDVRTLCLHSDTPGAAGLARTVRAELEAAGVSLRPFA